ncbi:MAG: c-type cytochrome [Novibacillus thermophilus]
MAHSHEDPEKIRYVGDSRVRADRPKRYPKDYSEFPGKTELFFPDFLLREWMVAVVVLVGFMALVFAHEAPLEDIADPTNTSYVPLPDWYFLFLYQLLKYDWSSGPLTPIGTVVIPGIAFGALFLAPWLDRGKERRPSKRPVATGAMLLAIVAIVYLTWAAVDEHSKNELAQGGAQQGGDGGDIAIVGEDSEGYEIYQHSSCVGCHASDLSGATAPALLGVGDKYSEEEILDIIDNGMGAMPPQGDALDPADKETLVAWLAQQKAEGGEGEEGENGEGTE